MTLKEQVIGICKAAPHLPYKALLLVSIIIMLPTTLQQFFESALASTRETTALFKSSGSVQERLRNNNPEYFFYLNYSFEVDGKGYSFQADKGGYGTIEEAESDLELFKQMALPINIRYDEENPEKAELLEISYIHWSVLLSLNIFMLAVAYLMKWMLLKYYTLELRRSSTPNPLP